VLQCVALRSRDDAHVLQCGAACCIVCITFLENMFPIYMCVCYSGFVCPLYYICSGSLELCNMFYNSFYMCFQFICMYAIQVMRFHYIMYAPDPYSFELCFIVLFIGVSTSCILWIRRVMNYVS